MLLDWEISVFSVVLVFFPYDVQIKQVLCTETQTVDGLGRVSDRVPRRPPQSRLVRSADSSSRALYACHSWDLSGVF